MSNFDKKRMIFQNSIRIDNFMFLFASNVRNISSISYLFIHQGLRRSLTMWTYFQDILTPLPLVDLHGLLADPFANHVDFSDTPSPFLKF